MSIVMDNCCGCGSASCRTVHVEAFKKWIGFCEFPLWLRGTYEWPSGESDGSSFIAAVEAAGWAWDQGLTYKGLTLFNGSPGGDPFILTRYRTVSYTAAGIFVKTPPDPPVEWSYAFTETIHRYSGRNVYRRGTNAGGTWYSYDLSDGGSASTTGSENGWQDYPELGLPQGAYYPWWIAIPVGEGSATLTVTQTRATLSIQMDPGITMTFTILLSDPYDLEDAVKDCDDMLDTVDLMDLSTDYGAIIGQTSSLMEWQKSYDIEWIHGEGTPLEMVYEWIAFNPSPVAERRFETGSCDFVNLSWVQMAKSRTELNNQSSSLQTEIQTVPVPAQVWGGTGEASEFPAGYDCVLNFTSGIEYQLVPGDMAVSDYGRITMQRECSGTPACTP